MFQYYSIDYQLVSVHMSTHTPTRTHHCCTAIIQIIVNLMNPQFVPYTLHYDRALCYIVSFIAPNSSMGWTIIISK